MTRDYATKRYSEHIEQKQKSYEKNVKFCRAVQSQPCLYDRTHSQLAKDINAAWRTVAGICGDSVLECKFRWQKIRFAFMRSLQTAPNQRHNQRPIRLPRRKYYLHDALEFFIPHIPTYYNAATEDESKDVEENKDDNAAETDDELTTSANEAEEDGQTYVRPTSSSTKKEQSFSLKEKKDRKKQKGKKISKDEEEWVNSDDDELQEIMNDSESEGADQEHVKNLRVKLNKVETEKTATDDFKGEDFEKNLRKFRFQRACKRSMDKSIVQQLSSPSPKTVFEPKRSRRSLPARKVSPKPSLEPKKSVVLVSPATKIEKSAKKEQDRAQVEPEENQKQLGMTEDNRPNSEPMLTTFIPSDIVETELNVSSSEDPSVVIQWTPTTPMTSNTMPLALNDASSKKSCVSFVLPASLLKIDRAVQCDNDLQRSASDDEFLHMLRPQMAAMNARQKMLFKQKIYKSLIEVFDDSSNFPNSNDVPNASAFPVPPFPGVDTTTGAEMCLIRELVSLVQAAKLTPELRKNKLDTEYLGKNNRSDEVTQSTPTNLSPKKVFTNDMSRNYKNSPSPNFESVSKKIVIQSKDPKISNAIMDEPNQRQLMRKIVKVSGGISNGKDGEKRRVFRILPKGAHSIQHPQSSTSGVGTFIIPRIPSSIASSSNAAAAVSRSAAYYSSDNNNRQISGSNMYVTSAVGIGSKGAASGTQRMMTVRSTIRQSGTCVPRQILRRYSVCGDAEKNTNSRKSTKVSTTTSSSPTTEGKIMINTKNTSMTNVRFVQASGTVTPPFKPPQPSNIGTQSMTTEIRSKKQCAVMPDKASDMEVQVPLTGFSKMFSSSAETASKATLSTTSVVQTPTKTIPTTRSSGQNKSNKMAAMPPVDNPIDDSLSILPHDGKESTAGVISSDFFDSLSIKSEPLDEVEEIL